MELCSSQHSQWWHCANEASDAGRRFQQGHGLLSWVVGAIHRIVQGCYGDDGIVLSIIELELELGVGGWWTGLLGTAIARVEQSVVTKGKERGEVVIRGVIVL